MIFFSLLKLIVTAEINVQAIKIKIMNKIKKVIITIIIIMYKINKVTTVITITIIKNCHSQS